MIYREAGQFKTHLRRRPADLPDPPGPRSRWPLLLASAFVARAAARQRVLFSAHPDPVPDPLAGRARPEHPDRATRASSRSAPAAFMAVGAFAATTSSLRIPGHPVLLAFALAGLSPPRSGIAVRPAQPAHQGLLPGGGDAGRAVLRRSGVHQGRLVHQLRPSGVITAQPDGDLRATHRTPRRRSTCWLLSHRRRDGAGGQEPGARRIGRDVDGDPRHGRRRRGDRHPPDPRPSCSRSRSARSTAASPARCARSRYLGTVEPEAFDLDLSFQHPVHGHHRRRWARSWAPSSAARSSSLLPIFAELVRFLDAALRLDVAGERRSNLELMVFGALIIFFLIVEPHGLARLWQIAQGKAAAVAVSALTAWRVHNVRTQASARTWLNGDRRCWCEVAGSVLRRRVQRRAVHSRSCRTGSGPYAAGGSGYLRRRDRLLHAGQLRTAASTA